MAAKAAVKSLLHLTRRALSDCPCQMIGTSNIFNKKDNIPSKTNASHQKPHAA